MTRTSNPGQPLIPTTFLGLDIPTQRWYALSFGVLLQALKVSDLIFPALSLSALSRSASSTYYFYKWLCIDVAYILTLPRLRLPKLMFAWQASLLQFFVILFINGLLFGPWSIRTLTDFQVIREWYEDFETSVGGYSVRLQHVIQPGAHLQGQHTVVLSPINTVQLNPFGEAFCLSPSSPSVSIPILFNNTLPSSLQYKHVSLSRAKTKIVDVSLKQLEEASPSYSEDDNDMAETSTFSISTLEVTEAVRGLKITRPGIISIESAGDARVRAGQVNVVECPWAEIVRNDKQQDIRCEGDVDELLIRVKGTPPLSLEYYRNIRNRRELFMVEGIDEERNEKTLVYEITIPLSLEFTSIGSHAYSLRTVTDSLRNAVPLNDTLNLNVIPRSAYSFRDCQAGKPAPLLVGSNTSTDLRIVSKTGDHRDGPWSVTVVRKGSAEKEVLSSTENQRDIMYKAKIPGTYEIMNVQGRFCRGIILSPESCRVTLQPVPYVNVSWNRIHECSGDTGVTASLMFHGKPPFHISYTTQHDSSIPLVVNETFLGSRGEITLQPEESGHYQYLFTKISDANYRDIAIEGMETMEQTVRPLAFAQFVRTNSAVRGGIQLYSCSGATVDVDVELKGTPPWILEVQVASAAGANTVLRRNITKRRETITLLIPHEIDQEGGTFQIDLVSIQDIQGCRRMLSVPGVSANVRRIKPTVKFYVGNSRHREMTILEGKEASLPLRLTGDGPWSIQYSHSSQPEILQSLKLQSANDVLKITRPGRYTIHHVHDLYCPGEVLTEEATYDLAWIPKPVVRMSPSDVITLGSAEDGYVVRPVCQGIQEHVDLIMEGRPPFEIRLSSTTENIHGNTEQLEAYSFSSIQRHSHFELQTSVPGKILYEVKHFGDASYPLHANTPSNGPRHNILWFQQDILPRPRAQFKSSEHLLYCLGDNFTVQGDKLDTGVVTLSGTPPYYLELSIMNVATSQLKKERVQLLQSEWKVAVSDYQFDVVGSYILTIDSIRDNSDCDQVNLDLSLRTIVIDVAETAALVPFEKRQDYCVGELLRFQLEGTPPWDISYSFNGRSYTASVRTPQFHRVADIAGTFSMTSLAHQPNMCRAVVSDINYNIHAIPSARVSQGRRHVENIREGEKAEIVFNLIGEPPFTFTYQRSEPLLRSKNAPLKVLETHTVSGIKTTEYSIYSSQEGTWTVTFIADKYCKYPLVSLEQT